MSFLSPLAALVAVAVVVPLAAHALLELRARRVSRRLGLEPPPLRSRLGVPGAIAVVAGLLGIAAAQPVVSGTRMHAGRSDAQVYVLFDASRSMLARASADAPDRLVRAKKLALQFRHGIPAVPFGIASLTDRVLRTEDLATDYNSLGNLATNNYYRPAVRKRLLVVMSDGESRFFDEVALGRALSKGHVRVLFVHLWDAGEKIYLQRKNVDPGYRPDPQSAGAAGRIAAAGDGEVVGEDSGVLIGKAKAFLGSGPETKVREQRTRVSLGPYVALAALLPLGFVLLRRNL